VDQGATLLKRSDLRGGLKGDTAGSEMAEGNTPMAKGQQFIERSRDQNDRAL
jgi:hypothetical protein